jgi:murein DD-endopeptidase MepM/ murein hydrolase activator NlpD
MAFWDNNKVILSGLAAAMFVFSAIPAATSSAADGTPGRDALDIAASLPNKRSANILRPVADGYIGDAAVSTVSSVKGIVNLMKQAQEISAMLPSRRAVALPSPKTDVEIALDAASRLPAVHMRAASKPAGAAPGAKAPKNTKTATKPASAQSALSQPKAKVPLPGSQELIWPVDGLIYSAFNATRGRKLHGAIDIVTKKGTPIAAAADGLVSVAAHGGKNFKGYGNIVILDHGGGLYTVYAHCDTLAVKMGQKVRQGELIGTVGRTGRATTDHCHFEVRISGKKYDPLAYLPSRPDVLKATNYHTSRKKK